MVTPTVAKKHREDMAQDRYLESVGHDSVSPTNPIPPITTESLFGQRAPPSPPADIDDRMNLSDTFPPADIDVSMNLDNSTFPPVGPPPPLPTTSSDFHFPSHQQPIQDNDFAPDVDPDARSGSPQPYDEDLERSALEEELRELEDIEYSQFSALTSHV